METSTVQNDISVMETSISENITNKSSKSFAETHSSCVEYESDKENDQSISNSFTNDIKTRNSLSSTKTHFNELQNSIIENQTVLKTITEHDLADLKNTSILENIRNSAIGAINSPTQRGSIDLFEDESDTEMEEIAKKMETSTISINDDHSDDVIEIGDSPVPVNIF